MATRNGNYWVFKPAIVFILALPLVCLLGMDDERPVQEYPEPDFYPTNGAVVEVTPAIGTSSTARLDYFTLAEYRKLREANDEVGLLALRRDRRIIEVARRTKLRVLSVVSGDFRLNLSNYIECRVIDGPFAERKVYLYPDEVSRMIQISLEVEDAAVLDPRPFAGLVEGVIVAKDAESYARFLGVWQTRKQQPNDQIRRLLQQMIRIKQVSLLPPAAQVTIKAVCCEPVSMREHGVTGRGILVELSSGASKGQTVWTLPMAVARPGSVAKPKRPRVNI